MLALGFDVATIRQRFVEGAPRIFVPSAWGIVSARFDARRLRGFIDSQVGRDTALASDKLLTGLAIVTKRLDTGSVWAISNNPHHRYFHGIQRGNAWRSGNGEYSLSDVLRASSAAPHHFSPKRISIFKGMDDGLFVDGAVSPHNNPALQLLMMAGISGYNMGGADLAGGEAPRPWKLGADKLLIVSVGTGSYDYKVSDGKGAALDAVNALQGMVSDGQELALTLLQWMSEPRLSWPVDRVVGDLTRDLLGRSEGMPQALLSFQRYDVRLEADWLAKPENMGRTFSEAELVDIRNFTSVKHMTTLDELGKAGAALQVRAEHFPAAFDLAAPVTVVEASA